MCCKIIQFVFIASCAKVEVTQVTNEGKYFYFKNQVANMRKLFGRDSIDGEKIDVIREGPSGYWVGQIKILYDEDGEYGESREYFGYRYFKDASGDWKPGDTLKSKRCAENGNYSNISN